MPVTDTSVVIKWLFREPGSAQALLFLEREVQFIAPDYLEIEFLSAISKKVRAGLFGKEEASLKREQFLKLPVRLIPVDLICELAFELATEYPITFYDAMFLATAIDLKDRLVTADEKLVRSLESTPFSSTVLSLNRI